MRRARFAVWSVCLSAVVLGSVAQANIITVNNLIDSGGSPGVCTLRAAITAANTNVASGGCGAGSPYPVLDTIQIPFTSTFCNLIGCTIVLTSPLPLVSEDVTIIGSGSGTPTISGNNLYRVLNLGPVTVNLTQLKIVSGNSGPGAGISIADPGGTVTISGVVFSGNQSSSSNGGAIFSIGTSLFVDNSTFVVNTAYRAAAIYHDGLSGGVLLVTNSTFSGNSASPFSQALNVSGDVRLTNVTVSGNSGGVLYLGGSGNPLRLNNVTITGNGGLPGGVINPGLFVGSSGGSGQAAISNSIIAGNPGTATAFPDCYVSGTATLTSQGHNLIGVGDGCPGFTNDVNGDKVGTLASPLDALLGPLSANGGPTQTQAPLAASPAISGGSELLPGGGGFAPCAATDQRGVARPIGPRCDMGAVESPIVDVDADGVLDALDNCTRVVNATQLDVDGDGYGNICDADLNNNGFVSVVDFALLRSVLGQPASASPTAAAADMNGSGSVTVADYGLLRARLGTAPGPSGLHP